jgi:hypothetical protein
LPSVSLTGAQIAGIVVGVAGLITILALTWRYQWQKRQRARAAPSSPTTEGAPPGSAKLSQQSEAIFGPGSYSSALATTWMCASLDGSTMCIAPHAIGRNGPLMSDGALPIAGLDATVQCCGGRQKGACPLVA